MDEFEMIELMKQQQPLNDISSKWYDWLVNAGDKMIKQYIICQKMKLSKIEEKYIEDNGYGGKDDPFENNGFFIILFFIRFICSYIIDHSNMNNKNNCFNSLCVHSSENTFI